MTKFLFHHSLKLFVLSFGAFSHEGQASCFVVSWKRGKSFGTAKENRLLSLLSSRAAGQSKQPRLLRPVFVTDERAVVPSALALQTWKVLTGQVEIPPAYTDEAVPDEQLPIVGLCPSHRAHEEALKIVDGQSDVIYHFSIDTAGSKNIDFGAFQQAAAYVGLDFHCERGGGNDALLEMASKAGSTIQQALQNFPRSDVDSYLPTMVISLDLELHLAMLRTNALPKQLYPAHFDSYHVAMPDGGSTCIEYYYDHQKTFGGSDPLLCPTKEILIEAPPTISTMRRSSNLAAAYTALCGQGMNSLASAAVAASVATILGDDGVDGDNTEVSWNVIERTVQLSQTIRQYGTQEQDPGFMRRKYIEFGYR